MSMHVEDVDGTSASQVSRPHALTRSKRSGFERSNSVATSHSVANSLFESRVTYKF